MGVPGLDPGLAIIRRHLRDEAFWRVVPRALWLLPAPARSLPRVLGPE